MSLQDNERSKALALCAAVAFDGDVDPCMMSYLYWICFVYEEVESISDEKQNDAAREQLGCMLFPRTAATIGISFRWNPNPGS